MWIPSGLGAPEARSASRLDTIAGAMPKSRTPFQSHLEELFACRRCPDVVGKPVTGGVEGAKIMLVGQAPGPHEQESGRPFAWTAGRTLFAWFEEIGFSEEQFRSHVHIAAVARCFPGRDKTGKGDRAPSREEIANCGAHLDREIELLGPEIIIAVGTLASKELVGISVLAMVVGKKHHVERADRSFDVVVLPHPSGRSTWLNDPENQRLLRRSLRLIGEHDATRALFSAT